MTKEPRPTLSVLPIDTAPASPPAEAVRPRLPVLPPETIPVGNLTGEGPVLPELEVDSLAAAQVEDNSVRGQIKDSFNAIGEGMLALGANLAKPATERWLHTVTQLEEPQEVGPFGQFKKVYTYTDGVALAHWPSDVGVLIVEVSDGNNTKTLTLGPTPESLKQIDPKFNPGVEGSHVMIIQNSDGSEPAISCVDEAELQGVELIPGQADIMLLDNPARGRQLKVSGQIKVLRGYAN